MTKQQDIIAIVGSTGAALGIVTDIMESLELFHTDETLDARKRYAAIGDALIEVQQSLLKQYGVEI